MSALNWEDIDNHLFDRYCVEGIDYELPVLYKEHDKAVAEYALNEFLKQFKEEYDTENNIPKVEKEYAAEVAEMVIEKFNESYNPTLYYENNEEEIERE